MLRRSFLISIFTITAFSLSAAADMDHKWDPDEKVKKMDERLNLTPEQETQIKDILKQFAPTQAEMDAMKKRKEEKSEAIKAVLTDDQKKEYDKMKEEWKEKKKEMKEEMEAEKE